ncbi:unnamed protein product [Parnassius apollo]|uniref:(apollo) hypothetical protein n=1 Tax=Parnassius apollo TaxID=110799 RepID=A0A8S3X5F6_PARAO|nr:unnamed protein product [Parnassius apollo]
MNALLELFKTKDPEANLDTVKKITTLRNCFKKEFNKVKVSERSGEGTAEIHVPKLWYYSEMLFLADVDVPRVSRSVDSILDDMPFEVGAEISDDENEANLSMNVQSPLSQSSGASSSRTQTRKTKAQADNVLAKIAKKLDEPPRAKQQYESFGEHIAEKLRNLPTMMATYCQKIFNDAIFMAETNNLTIDSHIVHHNSNQNNVNNSQMYLNPPNQNHYNSGILNNSVNQLGYSQQDHNILYEAFASAIADTHSDNTE